MPDDTILTRPQSLQRPPDLWRAWERTAGYVAFHHKQNVALSLTWTEGGWAARFAWADNVEQTEGQPGPGEALVALWTQVEAGYAIFESPLAAGLAPRDYPPDHWFSEAEQTIIERLVRLASERYQPPATLMIGYHPLGSPGARSQARLVGQGQGPIVGGQGDTLLEACRTLYRHAAARLGIKDDFKWY